MPLFMITADEQHWIKTSQVSESEKLRKWYHFAGTYDGRSIQTFLNGKPKNTYRPGTLDPRNLTPTGLFLVAIRGFGRKTEFHRVVDEIMIFTDILTKKEIKTISSLRKQGS